MKLITYVALLLCFISQSALAKMAKIEPTVLKQNANGVWIYEKVLDVPSTSKIELYKRVKKHIQTTVQSSDNVMTFDDVNYESIITSPTLSLGELVWANIKAQQLNFKLTVEFKDNKLRIFATSFSYYAVISTLHGGSLEAFEWNKVYIKAINEKVDPALTAFFGGIEEAAKSSSKSDW